MVDYALGVNFQTNIAQFVNDMARSSRSVSSATSSMSRSMGVARNAVLGLSGALAGIVSIRGITNMADSFGGVASRINLVTSSAQESIFVQKQLLGIARDTMSSYSSTAELYNRVAVATRDLGLEQSKILDVTKAVNLSFLISGASSAEAASSALQFAQGLASGALQGDELKSILEGNTRLALILADAFDTNVGGLKKLGEQGKLTAEKIIPAIVGSLSKPALIEANSSRINCEVPRLCAFGFAVLL
jgi:tape measure domain-containing protein